MISFNYNNAPDLLFWQGIRKFFDNYYLMCGTDKNKQGVFNIGPLLNYNSANNYTISYPESITTSVYGPNYIGSSFYSLVGSYKKLSDDIVYGFYFEGKLSDVNNAQNYKTISTGATYTYVHSTMGDILVGNYDKNTESPISAFLMIISTGKKIKIEYPGSTSNTVYGIWHNGGPRYTLCGGYSTDSVPGKDIYKNNQQIPIGKAYMVNYDIEKNKFRNWTTFKYPHSKNSLVTHFEGISSSKLNVYELAADTVNGILQASWVRVIKDKCGNFTVTQWIDYKYPLPGTITTSNSVANKALVGSYINESGDAIAYQAELTFA
jgi:hypothetical protein